MNSATAAETPANTGYRRDIDGLRALAVTSVLVGHAFPDAVPGGFIGVDVFFVISGFLISGIILTDIRDGRFSFLDFYSRRVRRIFPALTVVLLFSIAMGWLILLPFDFRSLGLHVAAGGGFSANILLWHESGNYFDSDAKLKPLLHLWSLGVEEQFYLLWPLLLYLARHRVRSTMLLIMGVAACSFALNVAWVNSHPSAAFYLPTTRTWELMLGSALAFLQVNPIGRSHEARARSLHARFSFARFNFGIACLSCVLIATALALCNDKRSFPGWWALLPTLGTVLLIASGPANKISRLLGTPPLVFVGRISYPLYLWHWPLLCYGRIICQGELPVHWRLLALIVSFLLAWMTYRLVENKLRHLKPIGSPNRPVLALSCGMTAVASCGLFAFFGNLQAMSASVIGVDRISEALHDWKFVANQFLPGDSPKTVLFFGDSHMQQYLPRVQAVAKQHLRPIHTLETWTRGGCAPIPGIERRGYACEEFVSEGLSRAARADVEVVIIAASWMGFRWRDDYFKAGTAYGERLNLKSPQTLDMVFQQFESSLRQLKASKKRVVLVLSSPRGSTFDPASMIRRQGLTFVVKFPTAAARKDVEAATATMDERLKALASRLGLETIDPLDYVCDRTTCPAIDGDGDPIYLDISHLRASTA